MSMHHTVKQSFSGMPSRGAGDLPVLTLAYIGDTVFDLYVRTFLIHKLPTSAHCTHTAAAKIVCASGQTAAFRKIEPVLNEPELRVYHRGRNAHGGSVPKNASVQDYRVATGLETLIGHLYWTEQDDRLDELMNIILEDYADEQPQQLYE